MSQRLLLTGASGYVGRLIARRFTAAGWEVVGLTRNPKPGEIAFELSGAIDPAAFASADALIHCAYDFAPTSWNEIEAVNVLGSARLFRAAREASIARLVLISTISAFESCKSKYGRAKLAIEAAAREAGACIIRPGLIYGRSPGAMFGRLVAQVRAGALIPMPGNGRQLMFTVHEDDLGEAVFGAASLSPAPDAPVTVANATPVTFRDIMRAIGQRLGRDVSPVPVPWQLMWLALRGAELVSAPIGLRSDSLISLLNQNPAPILNAESTLGIACRPFDLAKVAL